jgi:outer membrane protein OmpA-like peptidoglycan-associated protein
MAEDWLADVRKYAPHADTAVVGAIVRYCGIALQKRDSSLVAMSDSEETGRVRENFLKKKLALTDPDETLNAAIASVGERMKADRTKNRVTVYYLLAEHFGKLDLFGGGTTAASGESAAGAGTAALGAAGLAAAGGIESDPTPPPAAVPSPAPTEAGIGALGATAAAGVAAAASSAGSTESGAANEAASRFADVPDDGGSGSGMGKWLLWLLLGLLLIALFFGLRSCMNQQATVASNASDAAVSGDLSGTADNGTAAIDTNQAGAAAPGSATTPSAVPPAPTGAGVVAGTRNGLPMLTVYFDTGKADVSKDFSTVASGLKDYAAAHPDAKLAVSGFNDPTGNAAANAALSKRRAQGVAAALEATGVPAAAVALEKPADTTVTGTSNAEARRVEVTVKQ